MENKNIEYIFLHNVISEYTNNKYEIKRNVYLF